MKPSGLAALFLFIRCTTVWSSSINGKDVRYSFCSWESTEGIWERNSSPDDVELPVNCSWNALTPSIDTSSIDDKHVPWFLLILEIWSFSLFAFTDWWKNLVLQSPSFIHFGLNFYFQKISSVYNLSVSVVCVLSIWISFSSLGLESYAISAARIPSLAFFTTCEIFPKPTLFHSFNFLLSRVSFFENWTIGLPTIGSAKLPWQPEKINMPCPHFEKTETWSSISNRRAIN